MLLVTRAAAYVTCMNDIRCTVNITEQHLLAGLTSANELDTRKTHSDTLT